ncbi:MAG: hypothetical protein WAL89_22940 [Candidatus Sulfotelmatobacter sp.]
MLRDKRPTITVVGFILALTSLGCPAKVRAQKPPGAGAPLPTVTIGSGGISLSAPQPPGGPGAVPGGGGASTLPSPPPRVDDQDDLDGFRRALAVQATAEQISQYLSLLQSTRLIAGKFEDLRALWGTTSSAEEWRAQNLAFQESLDKVRSSNKEFLASFSDRQKSALGEITKKVIAADSRLGDRTKALEGEVNDPTRNQPEFARLCSKFEEALEDFREQLLDLGAEMNVSADNSRPLNPSLAIPPTTNSLTIGGETISVRTSGTISKTASDGAEQVFDLHLTASLGNLEHDITALLRSQLSRSDSCGEQVAIQQAALSPAFPDSKLWVHIHYERWICLGPSGSKMPAELREDNGAITLKISPAMQKDGSLRMIAETTSVEASGVLAEMLRGRPLGDSLRESVTNLFLAIVQNGMNVKAMLPPGLSDCMTMESAKFLKESGHGTLGIALEGHLRLSGDKIAWLDDRQPKAPLETERSQR